MAFWSINAVLADERANSYVTVNQFQDYWSGHFDTTTAAAMAAIDDPTTLLIRACRTIESLRFTEPVDALAAFHLIEDTRTQQVRSVKTNYGRPQKYNYFQHLQFPRTLDIYQDGTLYVPPEIQAAQCEQAAYEFTFDPSTLETRLQGVEREAITVGGVALSTHFKGKGTMVCAVAYDMCKPYLMSSVTRLQRA